MKKTLLMLICLSFTFTAFANEKSTQEEEQKTQKFDCSRKKCTEIATCEEAMYKLKQCGMKKLDRDKDGVPCETICSGG